MNTLLEIGLSNAVVAAVLALPVAGLAAVCRRPALAHALWLLVLVKLLTPPLVTIPVRCLPAKPDPTPAATPPAAPTASSASAPVVQPVIVVEPDPPAATPAPPASAVVAVPAVEPVAPPTP